MPKLNQILAIEKGVKKKVYSDLTKDHQGLQKTDLLSGISRTYQPVDEDGEKYPDEENPVQLRAAEVVKKYESKLAEYFNIVATKDFSNCEAKADIVVDGEVLVAGVPPTHLLWLEKQLDDLYTFVCKLPVLPSTRVWHWDDQQNCWGSKPAQTAKKKKTPRAFVKYEATEHHPAQVETVHEDRIEGYWTTTSFSGAMQASHIAKLKERVHKLQQAVSFAREQANTTQVEMQKCGDKILGYIFK